MLSCFVPCVIDAFSHEETLKENHAATIPFVAHKPHAKSEGSTVSR